MDDVVMIWITCFCCRGIGACIVVFVLFGVTHTPDGPFKRPHPGRHTQVAVDLVRLP